MFRNTYQVGILSIYYSLGDRPLQLWRAVADQADGAALNRVTDPDIQSAVDEILCDNIAKAYLCCPADPEQSLGVKMPIIVLIVKNLDRFFSFEVEVMDDRGVRRRFRASNYQKMARITDSICTMPLRLEPGWNQLKLNLAELTRQTYGTSYTETRCVTIHANCRLRRVYFSDKALNEDELPAEFKLYLPIAKR